VRNGELKDMEGVQCLILRNCTNISFETEIEIWNLGQLPEKIKKVKV